jgi:hypothetical protein
MRGEMIFEISGWCNVMDTEPSKVDETRVPYVFAQIPQSVLDISTAKNSVTNKQGLTKVLRL